MSKIENFGVKNFFIGVKVNPNQAGIGAKTFLRPKCDTYIDNFINAKNGALTTSLTYFSRHQIRSGIWDWRDAFILPFDLETCSNNVNNVTFRQPVIC